MGFLHGAPQRMTAAAAEGFAFQRVIPLLFVGLGKAELAGLYCIKHGFLNDGRVMVGNDAAVSIVDLFGNDLNIRVALYKVFNELALIGNAVAFAGMIVRMSPLAQIATALTAPKDCSKNI